MLGLEGEDPETVDTEHAAPGSTRVAPADRARRSTAPTGIAFDPDDDLVMHRRKALPAHPNGMTFEAFDAAGASLRHRTYYSVGGGFVVDDDRGGADRIVDDTTPLPHPFAHRRRAARSAAASPGAPSPGSCSRTSCAWRSERELRAALLHLWAVMQECVENGCTRTEPVLPGGLKVRRRAPDLRATARRRRRTAAVRRCPIRCGRWSGSTSTRSRSTRRTPPAAAIVTAPTNGAAGIVPAVLHYYIAVRRRRRPTTASSTSCSPRPRSASCSS